MRIIGFVLLIVVVLLVIGGMNKGKNGLFKKSRNINNTQSSNNSTPASQVPTEYKELYSLLEGKLDSFNQKVDKQWDGKKHPVVFSAGLITANPNAGDVLLQKGTFDTSVKYLDRLQELGVQGVAVDINFPLLTPQFHSGNGKYEQFLDFYKRLFAEIQKRGLKSEVEVQAIFPNYSSLNVKPYYDSLNFDEYKKGKLEMMKLIARELKPDYLTVANEPSTEAANTGQPMGGLNEFIEAVDYYTKGLKTDGLDTNIKIGAGFGTWEKEYKEFTRRTSAIAEVDFLNIHIYPVDGGLMDRTLEIADIAHQNGKTVAIHEAWLYKWKLGEGKGQGIAAAGNIYARDIYSFWQPLDQKFLLALANMAHYKKMEYISPFWSNYFFMYENYAALKKAPGMTYAIKEGAKAAQEGNTTETGLYYKQLISTP